MPISGSETLKAWKWCLLTFVCPQAPLLNGYQEHLSAREFSIILQIWHLGRSTTFCLTPSPSPSRLDSFSPSLRFLMSITKAKGKKLSGHNHPLSIFFFNFGQIRQLWAPEVPFSVPPKRWKWVILGVFGFFGGTENGSWGARIKILRPLFNTNTPLKPPFRHFGNHFGPRKSDFWPFCTFWWILVIFTGGGGIFWKSVWCAPGYLSSYGGVVNDQVREVQNIWFRL